MITLFSWEFISWKRGNWRHVSKLDQMHHVKENPLKTYQMTIIMNKKRSGFKENTVYQIILHHIISVSWNVVDFRADMTNSNFIYFIVNIFHKNDISNWCHINVKWNMQMILCRILYHILADFVYGSYKLDYDKQENLHHTIQLICICSKNITLDKP